LHAGSVRRISASFTPQRPYFGSSVRENSPLTNPELPLEAVAESRPGRLRARRHRRIPMGYDTHLHDAARPVAVGNGSASRLARALGPPALDPLLDEATTTWTPHRAEIYANLVRDLLTTHRDRAPAEQHPNADLILVMDGHIPRPGHTAATPRGVSVHRASPPHPRRRPPDIMLLGRSSFARHHPRPQGPRS